MNDKPPGQCCLVATSRRFRGGKILQVQTSLPTFAGPSVAIILVEKAIDCRRPIVPTQREALKLS